LIAVLKEFSERVWIPHHVALEFQKNRLSVIADQNKRFSDVRKTIDAARSSLEKGLQSLQLKERHALIDPDELLTAVGTVMDSFLQKLSKLEAAQQTLSGPDSLKSSIEEIFDQRVGLPPPDQITLDSIYKEAEERYERGMPPGFRDDGKEDEHRYRGILYKPKYGDVLVWKQILAHAKATSVKCLIFVTDDNKDDWWRKVPTASGPQTIGPRIELMEEALLEANVASVLFYRPAAFLKNAREFLSGTVSQEAIDEIQHVSIERVTQQRRRKSNRKLAVLSVSNWATEYFDEVETGSGLADLVGIIEGEKFAFDIRILPEDPFGTVGVLEEIVDLIKAEEEQISYSEYTVIFVSFGDDISVDLKNAIDAATKSFSLGGIKLCFGKIDRKLDGTSIFVPQHNVA
jgi:hypothetical protein